jgi:hypothetical protein
LRGYIFQTRALNDRHTRGIIQGRRESRVPFAHGMVLAYV